MVDEGVAIVLRREDDVVAARSGIVDRILPMTDEQREEVSEVPLTSRCRASTSSRSGCRCRSRRSAGARREFPANEVFQSQIIQRASLLEAGTEGLVPQFQLPKPRGRSMPPHIMRGNASRARVRVAIEHVFAAQKCRLGLVIRSVGLTRATARLGLANLVLVWFATRAAPA
jgi:hypothetical protein